MKFIEAPDKESLDVCQQILQPDGFNLASRFYNSAFVLNERDF